MPRHFIELSKKERAEITIVTAADIGNLVEKWIDLADDYDIDRDELLRSCAVAFAKSTVENSAYDDEEEIAEIAGEERGR